MSICVTRSAGGEHALKLHLQCIHIFVYIYIYIYTVRIYLHAATTRGPLSPRTGALGLVCVCVCVDEVTVVLSATHVLRFATRMCVRVRG